MGELFHKIQQLTKCPMLYFHRHMLAVKYDAVFIIIDIRGILHIPVTVLNRNRHYTMVLAGRMVQPATIPHIFPAQQTFWITALFCRPGRRNGSGILLRLGQVDCNIQPAILRVSRPFHISGNPVTADIIRVLAEFIIKIRCLSG